MKRIIPFSCLCLFLVFCEFAIAQNGQEKPLNVADLMPLDSFLPGWGYDSPPVTYPPDKLFEVVDGAAPLYLSYGFKEIAHARYSNKKDANLSISIDIYNMGSAEGAFGVFSQARSSDAVAEKIGTQGFLSGNALMAWKQNVYIYLTGDKSDEPTRNALIALGKMMMEKVSGKDIYPAFLQLLPKENKVPDTEKYYAKNFLGYDFLSKTVTADYCISDCTVTMFLVPCKDNKTVEKTITQFCDELKRRSERMETGKSGTVYIEHRSQGNFLLIPEGKGLVGFLDKEKNCKKENLLEFYNKNMRN